jgi:VRR-NUC domain
MPTLSENEDRHDSASENGASKRLRSSPANNECPSTYAAFWEYIGSPSTGRVQSEVSASGKAAVSAGASEKHREEDMDEDDVEFLFTVRPPSNDAAPRVDINTGSVESEADSLAEAYQSGESCEGVQFEARGTLGQPEASSSDVSSALQSSQKQRYAPVKSAYVQSLAEVSSILLHDTRWKCRALSGERRPLFQWEHGDDLAVILWFARRYQPDQGENSTPMFASCACLLCRESKNLPASASPMSTFTNDESEPTSLQVKSPDDQLRHTLDEEESDRSLYLYARLFYRKGPWFRLDDVFWKYYADIVRNPSVEKENHQPSKFDESRLERLCAALESLILNVECLQSKGVLRTFLDEAECGRACDTSLFKKEERSIILSKLGVRKPTGKPNEVWTQMRTQRSLFGKPGDGILLPVRKLVAETLKSRLLHSIVQACSPNYIPASKMKELVSQISVKFPNLSLYGCIRLRESPTMTLRRAVRLFVCATAGPGEMRGPSNGWTSLRNTLMDPAPPLSQLIPPPGIHCFSMVAHPGLMTRFGRQSALFQRAFQTSTAGSVSPERHVFISRDSFLAWEMATELRAQVDYLLELTETVRSNERRKNRGLQPRGERSLGTHEPLPNGSVDFWSLLSGKRGKIVAKLLSDISNERLVDLISSIDAEVEGCFADTGGGESLVEGERVLISIAVTCLHVLLLRCQTMEPSECSAMTSQPWLRHLFWESVLAYALWDIIPILERRELYRLAAKILETLVFGSPLCQECKSDGLEVPIFPIVITDFPLAPVLLSRRARGKAYDRLIIDHNHILSQDMKKSNIAKEEFKARRDDVVRFCKVALAYSLGTSTISFSSIRCLARRLKRPLAQTIGTKHCVEAAELGLRYENSMSNDKEDKRYRDWTPVVDTAVANALNSGFDNESGGLGGRCAFIGFEDTAVDVGSLNVEQLAMEYYRTGRFDSDSSMTSAGAGGWMGWHDEGSHVRALFRILCAPVLGIDGYCQASSAHCASLIFLSPYQQAPFDLHVGFSVSEVWCKNDFVGGKTANLATGFFYHRRDVIDAFLDKLSLLSPQELCDLVHESIVARQAMLGKHDMRFEQDCSRARTLSLIAAGCGGPLLSAMFRCLFFDYRHYSGGLPDLLLVRATYATSTADLESVMVSVEEWIGEGTFLNAIGGTRRFEDDEFLGCSKSGDSTSATRGTSNRAKWPNPATTDSHSDKRDMGAPDVETKGDSHKLRSSATGPERLQLVYHDKPVLVECIMVEVKSSNDRLDPRQEDWLNVIDRHGRARVCKFTATPSVKSAEST